jgi:hypothetical protein
MGGGIANANSVQWGQSTPTSQYAAQKAMGMARPMRRRKPRRARAAGTGARKSRRKAKTPRGRKARMVKGSTAARRYMAKIRKMRKRR